MGQTEKLRTEAEHVSEEKEREGARDSVCGGVGGCDFKSEFICVSSLHCNNRSTALTESICSALLTI